MKVEALIIYPIKSLQGIKVPKAKILEKGFQYDRRWMLVDENGKFITQRKHPLLSHFLVTIINDQIEVNHPSKGSILIPLILQQTNEEEVTIWDDSTIGYAAAKEINIWFTEAIGMKCSLVFMPENGKRQVDPSHVNIETTVSFADGYPYLILGQSSMEDLNSKMVTPLPIDRFRPNIIFSGGIPYEEDQWNSLKIGNVDFQGIKPCVRCVFTTIDQTTGKLGKEPLKTLNTYRKVGNGVIFGLNAIPLSTGTIRRGDVIVVKSKRN